MTEKPATTKRKRKKLPKLEDLEAQEKDRLRAKGNEITLTFPWKSNVGVRASRTFHIRNLTLKQARGARMVFDAIQGREALEDGHIVTFSADVVRWVFEKIADQLPWENEIKGKG